MKVNKGLLLLLVVFLLLCISYPLTAQESYNSGIAWNGYLQADNRLTFEDDFDLSWHEYRLDLKAEVDPFEDAHFYSEFWLSTCDYPWEFPEIQTSSDLMDKDNFSPWSMDLREAYVDLYGFLFENLDLRIGRQRIAWGTADKLNPTDNLNPDDLEDIWDFGRHLGSDGLKASCYLGDLTLTIVYIPIFTPAVLPGGDMASALSPPLELPTGLTLGSQTDTIIMPENNLMEGATVGVKSSMYLLGYDISLSYLYGRDDLVVARKVTLTGAPVVDIASELVFPRMHIAGMDAAGDIFGVGVWAEAAVFFPEEIPLTTDSTAAGGGIEESIALSDEPYVKYVVGLDYTFKNGIYINGQYLHGFIHERETENLEDYFMFGMEWKLLNDRLKIIPISGGVEIKDFNDIENNYALILAPEITYYPVDNAEIAIGFRWLEGKDSTAFGRVKDNDELYLKAKYSF